jgi:hypothetical protein
VVLLAVGLQLVFLIADGRQTATKTAVEFAEAFFRLDADMENFMCSDLTDTEYETAAAAHIREMTDRARDRGFTTGMVRESISHVKAETLFQDAESATIHLHGKRRTNINPVFAFVAKLFRLGETREFDETLELVKQDGTWKVCGEPFGMTL